MNHNAIQRRFSGAGVMDVETLVKIADRYSLDLLDLMVESGLITADRANSLRVGGSIRDVSNEDLMGEVLRRMNTTPVSPANAATRRGTRQCAAHTLSTHRNRERIHRRQLRPRGKTRRTLRQ